MGTVVSSFGDSKVFYLNETGLSFNAPNGGHPDTNGANTIAAKVATDIQAQMNSSGVVLGVPGSGGGTKAYINFQ